MAEHQIAMVTAQNPGAGSGTVTSVSGVTANGVSFSIANATSTPAITIALGAITPSTVAATGAITGPSLSVTGNLTCNTAGGGLLIKGGSNATAGSAVLVAGDVVVSTTKVTANSLIFLTKNVLGGTAGRIEVSARTPGTSFTIHSSSVLDTGTVAWLIVEPA